MCVWALWHNTLRSICVTCQECRPYFNVGAANDRIGLAADSRTSFSTTTITFVTGCTKGKLSIDDNGMRVDQTLKYFLNRFNPSFSVRHKLLYVNNIICYVRTITRSHVYASTRCTSFLPRQKKYIVLQGLSLFPKFEGINISIYITCVG
jgi:hypothetical protein